MGHRIYKNGFPVIFFNFDSQKWEAVDKESGQSILAASYRNQLDALERLKLLGNDEHANHEDENSFVKKKKARRRGIPSNFAIAVLAAAIFYALWVMTPK